MQKEICHAARTAPKYQTENHRNKGKNLRDKIVEQEEKAVVFSTKAIFEKKTYSISYN